MPGISRQRVQQQKETQAALDATGNTGRGAVRIYGGDSAGTIARKQEILGQINAANGTGAPKATAAPTAAKENIFTGLCEALNTYQQGLIKAKKRQIADKYVIEFAPPEIGGSTVKRPGPQDTTTATMQTPNSAAKIDPARNKVNTTARTWPVEAGTQILKLIDDVMRNSSYITGQQNVEISTATDPVTGIQKENKNPKPGNGDMRWYKISLATKQLGYDNIIRDHAYEMRFIITPYAIGQMTSMYFPDSRYRGVHKAYNYWFTGANSQILHYEQAYNNAYRLVLSGIGADSQQKIRTDFRDQNRYIYMATSNNQATGAKNYANEPGDNGASFLYDPTSLSTVRLRIVGDPAWMQQGEVGLGVSARTFDFNPYNSDGSINYDSQAVMFSVAFNTPVDYDLSTGLMNTNTQNRNGQPQEYYTFTAIKCKNIFSRGKFEQEIEGKLVLEKNTQSNQSAAPTAVNGRPGTTGAGTVNTGEVRTTGTPTNLPYDGSLGYSLQDETGQVSELRRNEYGDLYSPVLDTAQYQAIEAATGLPSPQPASPPAPPDSSGDIVAYGDEDAQQVAFRAPPVAGTADQLTTNGVAPTSEEIEARNAYIAAGAPSTGPLREAYVSAQSAFNNRAAAAGPTASTQAPQLIAKDD